MTNPIVQVNVYEQAAPVPNTLQQTTAVISQGATNLSEGTYSFLTQEADLTDILNAPLAIASMTWTSDVVTVTTAAAIGIPTSTVFPVTIAGAQPVGYDGTFEGTVTGTDTFTFPLAVNPGSNTTPGTYVIAAAAELQAFVTEWFAQGRSTGVYVLELGAGTPAQGVTALSTFIDAQAQFFYTYIVPHSWDGVSSFYTLAQQYVSTTARTYFYTTTTVGTYSSVPAIKSLFAMVETPAVASEWSLAAPADWAPTEFDLAAVGYVTTNYRPNSSNQVTPLAFSYLFDVTQYPLTGNGTLLSDLRTKFVNIVGTGAEGGLANTILMYGRRMDGTAFNFWYATDWAAINCDQAIAAAIIQGSNLPSAPLWDNQAGINRLQSVGASVLGQGVSNGLLLGTVLQTELDPSTFATNFSNGLYEGFAVINAVPFSIYYAQNPEDYALGSYAGFAIVITPQTGFEAIIINLTATQLAG